MRVSRPTIAHDSVCQGKGAQSTTPPCQWLASWTGKQSRPPSWAVRLNLVLRVMATWRDVHARLLVAHKPAVRCTRNPCYRPCGLDHVHRQRAV